MVDAKLTLRDVAAYLQVNEKTIYRMAQAGVLPGFKVGRQWRLKREDIDRWVESKKGGSARRQTQKASSARQASGSTAHKSTTQRKRGH